MAFPTAYSVQLQAHASPLLSSHPISSDDRTDTERPQHLPRVTQNEEGQGGGPLRVDLALPCEFLATLPIWAQYSAAKHVI